MSAQTESTYRTTRWRVCSLPTEAPQHSRSRCISTRRSRVCSRPPRAERLRLLRAPLSVDSELYHPGFQCRRLEPENLSRAAFAADAPASGFQHRKDVAALDFVERQVLG